MEQETQGPQETNASVESSEILIEQPPKQTVFGTLKRYFIAGVATIFPLFITIYIIIILYNFYDKFIGQYVNAFLIRNYGFSIPGMGIVVSITIIIFIGILSRHFFGKRILPLFERMFKKIPFVANIYPSAKQLSNYLFESEKREMFKKVVVVEYPTAGSYALGFITNENLPELSKETKKTLINVFVPFAPMPFSGILLQVPREKVKAVKVNVEQAIKFIVSGGVIPFSET